MIVLMKKLEYRITGLPVNLYLSPKYFFDWWESVQRHNGLEAALNNKSQEFKLARELWVGAMYATAMRKETKLEHWVARVDDTDPDSIVAFFDTHEKGWVEYKYPIEVTTYGKHSDSLVSALKNKLIKNYPDYTRIICYVTDIEQPETINKQDIRAWVSKNNPTGYDVWLLYGLPDDKFVLSSLTSNLEYIIDYPVDSQIPNIGDVFQITGRGTSDTSKPRPFRGQIKLLYPDNT